MTTAGHDRFRKAALTLHGLSRRDQAWLLRRLLPSMRGPLQSLLGQLRKLGIAPGLQPDDSALPPAEASSGLDAAEVKRVDAADLRRIATVLALQDEPLQAVLLNLHPWRWRAGYWDGLSAFQRSRMAELCAAAPKPRPAMLDALLHCLAQALADANAVADAAPMSAAASGAQP